MTEVKWIKITTDIFDDDKIKIIDKMPARDEILVIWFKLLALAGKVNQSGLLFLSNRIPYTTELLAAVFNRDEQTVRLSLGIFEKYGMIHIEANEIIAISNWEKHQNIDGLERVRERTRQRVGQYRERQKLEASNVTCNVTVTHGNAVDIDKDIDIEKEVDKEIDENISPDIMECPPIDQKPITPEPNVKNSNGNRFSPPSVQDVKAYCMERGNSVNSERFVNYYESNGWMVGKSKMKNWKAAVRTWEGNSKNSSSNMSDTDNVFIKIRRGEV